MWFFYNSRDFQLQKMIVKIEMLDFMEYLHGPQFIHFENKYINR